MYTCTCTFHACQVKQILKILCIMYHKYLTIICMSCPTNLCTFYVCNVPQIPVHLVYVISHKFLYILCMSCPTNSCTCYVCHVPQSHVHFMYVMSHKFLYILCMSCPTNTCTFYLCVMVYQLSPIKYLDLPSQPVKVFCELIFVFFTGCHCLFNLSQL